MKLFLSCICDRIAYEYTSKRKEFLIYADDMDEAVGKLQRYKRLIPWYDADHLAKMIEVNPINIKESDEEMILRGELNAYCINKIADGRYEDGFIMFGRSAAEVRRRLPEFAKSANTVISVLPKITDIIL